MQNRRADIRYDFRNEISCARGSEAPGETFKAITVDISSSGIGIYSFTHLPVGQKITIREGLEGAHRQCTVAWCKELGDDVFRAGLYFTASG